MIIKHTFNEIKNDNFDFFYGSIGGIHYLTQRVVSAPEIKDDLIELVSFFLRKRNVFDIFWRNKNDEFNMLDLSISHGQAAIIFTFTNLIKLDILSNKLTEIVYSMVNKILSFIEANRIPDAFNLNPPVYSPLRWCHGELGIKNSLVYFANIHNDRCIKEQLFPVAKK